MKNQNRKKFLLTGLSLAAVAAFFNWRKQPEKTKNTVTFLTQDGRLVEVDADKLPAIRKVATQTDVKNWIKK